MREKLKEYQFVLPFQAENDEVAKELVDSLQEGAIDSVEDLVREKGWKVKFGWGDWERVELLKESDE